MRYVPALADSPLLPLALALTAVASPKWEVCVLLLRESVVSTAVLLLDLVDNQRSIGRELVEVSS